MAFPADSSGNLGVGIAGPKTKMQLNGGILRNRDKNIAHANGTYIVWSTVRDNIGETEFINYKGTGTGGFRFYNVSPQGSTGTASFPDNDIAFINTDGTYNNVSDKRVKTNVNIIENGLAKVMAMRPVSYDFHLGRTLRNGVVKFTENDKTVNRIGFLAQELEKVGPEAVLVPKDPANELYNVAYSTLIPVLTKAIQEQPAEIEKLKAQLVAYEHGYLSFQNNGY
ncbi:MAG: tail fiber domain-containing protein [Dyadobacter sp.]|uniref:tail fiber domain-containing protein n=1 Tax=Dyadobacter sp. TaxID=1914288 RepID=UPI001B0CBF33|nr:tail fiber domain-containing protein [Dyadobacter sp.]MBO9614320.1 tail fiber domain-containing protein [Dyadobacter sp.]